MIVHSSFSFEWNDECDQHEHVGIDTILIELIYKKTF